MDDISSIIYSLGEKLELPSNFQISLFEKGYAWFLEKGSVNIFAVDRKPGKVEGARTFLSSFSSPSLMFSFEQGLSFSYEIVFALEEDSIIWKISLDKIRELLDRKPEFLNNWINKLALFYEKELDMESEKYIEPESIHSLEKEERVSIKRSFHPSEKNQICWISVQEGEVDFLGFDSLKLSPHTSFPLTYHGWVKCRTPSILKTLEKPENWREGLYHFHSIFMDYILVRKRKDAQKSQTLLLNQKEDEERNIHSALLKIVSILNPLEQFKFYGGIDPLFLACQKIGSYMNVSFQMPEEILKTDQAHQLIESIAHASNVRHREVTLREKWWKRDCGYLLGFFGLENQPVALVRNRMGSYIMIDAITGRKTRINHAVAKKLKPVAFAFYHTFPDELRNGREVLSFYLKNNYREFLPFLFYGLMTAILSLVTPFMIQILLNRVVVEANMSLLWQVSLALFLAAISSSFFLFFRSLTFTRIEGISSDQMQSAFWDRLLKLPIQFFRKDPTGDLISRVISIEKIRSLLSGSITRAIFSGIFSVVYIIAMAFFSIPLTIITLAIISLGFLILLFVGVVFSRKQLSVYNLQGKINTFLIQIIPMVGKLRTSGAENNAFSKWAHLFSDSKKVFFKAEVWANLTSTINYILPFVLYLFIFSYLIAYDGISPGTFLAFNAALVSFYLAMVDLSNTLLSVAPAISLWNRIKVIIKEPLEERSGMNHPGKLTGEISVDELFFKYEDTEINVLEDIRFKVHPKEFIGIVGPSGSGKSTLMRLLIGFEKPSSGSIYYDGKDLSTLDVQEVRKQLGIVFQEEGILSGTILENLVCGGAYKSEQINEALQISGFSEDVESFPMGLHTFLSTGGGTLSGGQKQRLLIARALLFKPKILLFDEATSALDNKNQKKVSDSIAELDVTRIVIAHRLSTIRRADRIYVLESGRVIQHGTFEELAAQSGLFSEMLKRQEL